MSLQDITWAGKREPQEDAGHHGHTSTLGMGLAGSFELMDFVGLL